MIPISRVGLPFALTPTGKTIRSVRAPSSCFCCDSITSIPTRALEVRRSAPQWTCSRRERCLTDRSVRSTCGWPSTGAGSTLTCATAPGGRSRSIMRGWRVVDRPPAKFRRTRGAQPLPEPERGGSLEELRPFFNVDRHGWILIRAFLVAALRPGFSLPILVAKGEQGAGKSTACRVLSSLIDPRTSALRGVPREVRDLTAAARNSWLVCFDNLSRLPEELADAACRLATGGGFGGRQLYSDHDEAIFDATRPLVFNAIPDLGTARPDFLDRALIVEFLSIKPETRRDEAQFWREFSERQPRILGVLLDAAVMGLRNLPEVKLARPPRLADFALWVSACEEALGMGPGEALAACQTNSAEARDLALEASPLYGPLAELAREGFTGTVAELHTRLDSMVSDAMRRSVRWPKAPNGLGNALRRMVTNLRAAGVELQFSRNDVLGRRVVSVVDAGQIRKTPSVAVSSRQ